MARVADGPQGPQRTATHQTLLQRSQTPLLKDITDFVDRTAREAYGNAPAGMVRDLLPLLERVRKFVTDALSQQDTPPTNTTTDTLLQKVLNRLEKVETKLETRSTAPSYAAVAARGLAAVPTPPPPQTHPTSYERSVSALRTYKISRHWPHGRTRTSSTRSTSTSPPQGQLESADSQAGIWLFKQTQGRQRMP